MERLTERFDGWVMRKGCHGPCRTCHRAECADIYPMIDRLAAYEDTGLEPKQAQLISNVLREVGETYNCWFDYVVNCVLKNSHLKELAQAEKDGRLVVLPCKPGDKVKVDVNSWGNVWNYKTYDFGKFLHGEIVSISITKKQFLMKIRVNHNVYWKKPMKRYPISALGKTVFLTREEAEAALKKREEADNEAD